MQSHPPSERKADVRAGRIVGAFGLTGELKLDASRIGDDALRPGLHVSLRFDDGRTTETTVVAVRRHKGRPLVRMADIDDATAAAALGTPDVFLARDDAPLGAGEYFDADLIGCRLIDESGDDRGSVVDVIHYPLQDMLVVGTARALVPLVHAFVLHVDVDGKAIRVRVPPGLLDAAQAERA